MKAVEQPIQGGVGQQPMKKGGNNKVEETKENKNVLSDSDSLSSSEESGIYINFNLIRF